MRLLAVLLAGILCFVLASCPGGGGDDDTAMTNGAGNNTDSDTSDDMDVWDE